MLAPGASSAMLVEFLDCNLPANVALPSWFISEVTEPESLNPLKRTSSASLPNARAIRVSAASVRRNLSLLVTEPANEALPSPVMAVVTVVPCRISNLASVAALD